METRDGIDGVRIPKCSLCATCCLTPEGLRMGHIPPSPGDPRTHIRRLQSRRQTGAGESPTAPRRPTLHERWVCCPHTPQQQHHQCPSVSPAVGLHSTPRPTGPHPPGPKQRAWISHRRATPCSSAVAGTHPNTPFGRHSAASAGRPTMSDHTHTHTYTHTHTHAHQRTRTPHGSLRTCKASRAESLCGYTTVRGRGCWEV